MFLTIFCVAGCAKARRGSWSFPRTLATACPDLRRRFPETRSWSSRSSWSRLSGRTSFSFSTRSIRFVNFSIRSHFFTSFWSLIKHFLVHLSSLTWRHGWVRHWKCLGWTHLLLGPSSVETIDILVFTWILRSLWLQLISWHLMTLVQQIWFWLVLA